MLSVSIALWISLGFLVLAGLGSLGYAGVRGWRLWKRFRATSRSVSAALSSVTSSAESAEQHAVALSGGGERLTTAIGRLQEALAELAVIRSAAGEAQAALASVRGLVPRK